MTETEAPTSPPVLEAAVPVAVPLRRRRETDHPSVALPKLHQLMDTHRLWSNPLLKACENGELILDDYRFVFAQYYQYSKNFTRYLSALMTNCENDFFRSKLAENLWEEGGARVPEERHAEIFRNFLRRGLGVDVQGIVAEPYAELFSKEYLDFCIRSTPAATSAFLSLGTEAIVARMYEVFLAGLRKAGVPDEHLLFFKIHIECDDEHAETIEQLMASYFEEPDWYNTCLRAMNHALDLRDRFFSNLYASIQRHRVQGIIENIQARKSLAPLVPRPATVVHHPGATGDRLYANHREDLCIDFTVERLPFDAEVFDARMVRIAPGMRNERHRHAHESIFYVISGYGRVIVNDGEVAVAPGDIVFVPRWAFHQTQNAGTDELVFLAVTDFGLTGKAFIGDYLRTARLTQRKEAQPVATN